MKITETTQYALVTKTGAYLSFEQVGNREIDVYNRSHIDYNSLFDTEENAVNAGKEMLTNDSDWEYRIFEDMPYAVVKVTIMKKEETVSLL